MSQYAQRMLEQHQKVIQSITPIAGEADVQQAVAFAEMRGVTILSYGPHQREYRMSDDETYSIELIREYVSSEVKHT